MFLSVSRIKDTIYLKIIDDSIKTKIHTGNIRAIF